MNNILRIAAGALGGVNLNQLQRALDLDLLAKGVTECVTIVIDDELRDDRMELVRRNAQMFEARKVAARRDYFGFDESTPFNRRPSIVQEFKQTPADVERAVAAEQKRLRKNAKRARNELASRIGRE